MSSILVRLVKAYRSLGVSRDQIDADYEMRCSAELGAKPVAKVKERQRVRIAGSLQSVTYQPASRSATLDAVLFDGSGTIDVHWMGRRDICGIDAGSHVLLTGIVSRSDGELCLVNPSYELLV